MNKIGFQANLFIIVLILLISITIFISCEKDNYTGLSKENLYGKWIGPTTMKVFDFETQMAKPINNILSLKVMDFVVLKLQSLTLTLVLIAILILALSGISYRMKIQLYSITSLIRE
ncbi:MAG: hypothetical protein IPF52_12660 [Saprospiraceae bacterium]|nr:hypothetical protein [Saprospiraceae bacterium]